MLMLYSIGAETHEAITCGKVTAQPQNLPENASCLGRAPFNGIQGEWFRLYLDEELYGFEEELEQSLPWRDFERGNYPLYFKNTEIAADFKAAVQSLLSLSPSGEGVFLSIRIGLSNNNICGVISDAELFKLTEDCKILSNVGYFVKKTEDLTERFLKANKRGVFTKDERSAAVEKISAQIPNCGVDNDDNVWLHFYDKTGGGKYAMLHGYLKILFTNTDISFDGTEIVKCAGYNDPAFSIDLNTTKDILGWHSEESVVNPLFFSVSDLFFATV